MNQITAETASFLDSAASRALAVDRAHQRTIVERFLQACYQDLGKAPRFLDGQDLHTVVGHALPGRFGKKDPLAADVPATLHAYLDHLQESAVVSEMFELRRALDATLAEFATAVRTGQAVHHHHAPQKPFVHRGEKVGRNDPCPCGSGKKFKQCCAKL